MVVQRGLEPIFSLDRVLSAGGVLLSSRAGLFLRFLLAGVVFAACAVGLRRLGPQTRAWAQVLVSLALIGTLATPGIATGMAAYALVLFWTVERAPLGRARAPVAILLLAVQLIAPIVWLPRIAAYVGTVREFVAFATNVTLLRSWGYVYDRLRRPEPEPPSLRDYALFMFFFPAFANGPLVSLDEFRRRRLPGYWDDGPGGARVLDLRALGRVATAVVALALALQLVSMFTSPAFETAASAGTLAAWRQAAGTYLGLYLGFTAWTEAAIGLAALGGVVLPENFSTPHFAYGLADFWRRWNITLGHWLRSYVYLPLGGALPRGRSGVRRPEWRNTATVFGVMAAYHLMGGLKLVGPDLLPLRAYLPWILWALMNTAGVLATRHLSRATAGPARRAAVTAATLAFSCVATMTAFFPPDLPLRRLGQIYRQLCGLG
jgi:hypothetical protein